MYERHRATLRVQPQTEEEIKILVKPSGRALIHPSAVKQMLNRLRTYLSRMFEPYLYTPDGFRLTEQQ